MNQTKMIFALLVTAIVFWSGQQLVFACDGGHGPKGCSDTSYAKKLVSKQATSSNAEQLAIKKSFLLTTMNIRKELVTKNMELSVMLKSSTADTKRAGELAGEIFFLKESLRIIAWEEGLNKKDCPKYGLNKSSQKCACKVCCGTSCGSSQKNGHHHHGDLTHDHKAGKGSCGGPCSTRVKKTCDISDKLSAAPSSKKVVGCQKCGACDLKKCACKDLKKPCASKSVEAQKCACKSGKTPCTCPPNSCKCQVSQKAPCHLTTKNDPALELEAPAKEADAFFEEVEVEVPETR